MMARTRLVTMLGAAALATGACSRPAPSAGDDALRQDLAAAQAQAATASAPRLQFVSPLELGRAADDAPARSAARVAAVRPAAASPARHTAAPVTPVARVSRPAPAAPAPRVARPAPAEVADAPAPAAERTQTDAPSIDVEVAPLPAPSRDEPVVAAPSRRSGGERGPERRGRVWTTGDVIRNAPFPINP